MLIETTTFRLSGSTADAVFTVAERRLAMEVLYQQPGFVRRTTASDGAGSWLALSMWRSAKDADAARDAIEHHPASAAYRELLDPTSVNVQRYVTLD